MDDPSRPSSSSSSRNDTKMVKTTGFFLLTDDLLHNILARLPAPSFASAACVSKSWNRVSSQVLSRPKLASALSLDPSPQVAVREVIDKVLTDPIRPDFAIASVGSGFRLYDIFKLISKKLGTKTPIIISTANGIIGRDALTDELKEWDLSDDDGSITSVDENFGIVLTVGFVPGLKVDVIPLLRSTKELRDALVEKFVMDIRDYTDSVSGCKSPVGIILFGMAQEGLVNMKPILNILDYAMPEETVIVGDERGRFLYRTANESRNFCGSAKFFTDAVALTFARDRNNTHAIGNIQFHVALSNGVSAIGPTYRAASIRVNCLDHSTWLTAKIEGQRAILDGQRIMNDINVTLEDHVDSSDLYIGVTKRRNCSIGSERPRIITFLSFYGIVGGDEEYLYVNGLGIRTGNRFQFYGSDPDTALNSIGRVSLDLKNFKFNESTKNISHEVFGGFIFSCYGRGDTFFTQEDVDSSPFVKNFPGVPFAGIFCGGEIGRSSSSLTEEVAIEDAKDSAAFVFHFRRRRRRTEDTPVCVHDAGSNFTTSPLKEERKVVINRLLQPQPESHAQLEPQLESQSPLEPQPLAILNEVEVGPLVCIDQTKFGSSHGSTLRKRGVPPI
ncbi:F-box/LRR-repeat protein [Morus notabilis]|uniref:F-box/LRR-repeat protein n=1 Tax=Morus notabilis TaxID=981085 RepID=W9QC66_9ROSA|nr:F-box/LRR-repeat protein [Morus notabilis]